MQVLRPSMSSGSLNPTAAEFVPRFSSDALPAAAATGLEKPASTEAAAEASAAEAGSGVGQACGVEGPEAGAEAAEALEQGGGVAEPGTAAAAGEQEAGAEAAAEQGAAAEALPVEEAVGETTTMAAEDVAHAEKAAPL